MPIASILKCSGLQTFKNALSELDLGALVKADNVVIDRDSVIESRRGFKLYGDIMSSTAKQLLIYKDRILRHYGNILDFDNGSGTLFTPFQYQITGNTVTGSKNITSINSTSTLFAGMSISGTGIPVNATITKILTTTSIEISLAATITATNNFVCKYNITEVSSEMRIKYIEANGNLYLTTSKGIKKISASDASNLSASSISYAGVVKALDITLHTTATSGFLEQDSIVGYRAVWGIKDSNNNLILGAPSERSVISSPIESFLNTDSIFLTGGLNGQKQKIVTFPDLIILANAKKGDVYKNIDDILFTVEEDITAGTKLVTTTNSLTPIVSSDLTKISGDGSSDATIYPTLVTEFSSGINDGYTPSPYPSAGITASEIKNYLTGLGAKIDQDVSLPTITSYAYSSGTQTLTVNFASAISPILKVNDYIKITGTNHNGIYKIETVSSTSVTVKTINSYVGAVAETAKRVKYIIGSFRTNSDVQIPYSVAGLELKNNYLYIRFNGDISSYVYPEDIVTISGLLNTYSEVNGNHSVYGVLKRTNNTYDTIQIKYTHGSDWTPEVSTTDVINAKILVNKASNTLELSANPTSDQLLNLQSYYNKIVTNLNNEPRGVAKGSDFDNCYPSTSRNVGLTISIPPQITTDHFLQVYRTYLNTSSGVSSLSDLDPGEEFKLCYEATPTLAEIQSGSLSFTDQTTESFLGANLYTNAISGEGILQANDPPPTAHDISLYKNYTFYANTSTKHKKTLSLLSVLNFVNGVSNFVVSNGTTTNTYTFNDQVESYIDKKIWYTSENSDPNLTIAQRVEECARSLIKVVNSNPNEVVFAYYLSGQNDVPGQILFESREQGNTSFYIQSNVGSSFTPNITNSSYSDNEVKINRIYYSKYQQPEAVPSLVNYIDIGPKDKEIKRILALRDSLFILKEEGVYRLSGESAPFVVSMFDNSVNIISPDSACVLNNQIYALTRQGVVSISESGISIVSRAIENLLQPLSKLTNFQSATFGLAYESYRSYYLFLPTINADTSATQCFRYNTFTNTWTRLLLSKTCGLVTPSDKMYLGASDTPYLEVERKDYSRTDYADREYIAQVVPNEINGKNVKIIIPDVNVIEPGDIALQYQYITIAQYNRLLKKLDNDTGVADEDYHTTLKALPGADLRQKLLSLAQKLDADTLVNGTNYYTLLDSLLSPLPDTSYNNQQGFNLIVNKLNADTGPNYINYQTLSGYYTFESKITDYNINTSYLTTEYAYPFVFGEIVIVNHIKTEVEWAPNVLGDATQSKQIRESTVMFEDTSFTSADVSFSTDISVSLETATFTGKGNGGFGNQAYGSGVFGSYGQAAPIRTFIPRNKQRCRYIHCNFKHATAREKFSIYGISYVFEIVSPRAYRRV